MRKLKSYEIDLRIGVMSKKTPKASLLLYKDSRCDMDLMDETYGVNKWQCTYEKIDGVLYCSVGVYSDDIKNWAWKTSNGIESKGTGTNDPNNVKGEASDAFKRACVMWGIGRELYKWKDIWIDYNKDTDKWKKFFVTKIAYKDNGDPKDITIVDENNKVMYQLVGGKYKKVKQDTQANSDNSPSNHTEKAEKVASEPKNDVKSDNNTQEQPVKDIQNTIKERNSKIYKSLLETIYEYGLSQAMTKDDSNVWTKDTLKKYFVSVLKLPFPKIEMLLINDIRLDETKTEIIINDEFMKDLMNFAESEVFPF